MNPVDILGNEFFSYFVVYFAGFCLLFSFVGYIIQLIVALLYKIIR